MAKKGTFNFAVLGEGSVELYAFECVGAGPRDGQRYIRMRIGSSDYAMTPEIADSLGRLLVSAAEQLPSMEFKRDDCGDGGD